MRFLWVVVFLVKCASESKTYNVYLNRVSNVKLDFDNKLASVVPLLLSRISYING